MNSRILNGFAMKSEAPVRFASSIRLNDGADVENMKSFLESLRIPSISERFGAPPTEKESLSKSAQAASLRLTALRSLSGLETMTDGMRICVSVLFISEQHLRLQTRMIFFAIILNLLHACNFEFQVRLKDSPARINYQAFTMDLTGFVGTSNTIK